MHDVIQNWVRDLHGARSRRLARTRRGDPAWSLVWGAADFPRRPSNVRDYARAHGRSGPGRRRASRRFTSEASVRRKGLPLCGSCPPWRPGLSHRARQNAKRTRRSSWKPVGASHRLPLRSCDRGPMPRWRQPPGQPGSGALSTRAQSQYNLYKRAQCLISTTLQRSMHGTHAISTRPPSGWPRTLVASALVVSHAASTCALVSARQAPARPRACGHASVPRRPPARCRYRECSRSSCARTHTLQNTRP